MIAFQVQSHDPQIEQDNLVLLGLKISCLLECSSWNTIGFFFHDQRKKKCGEINSKKGCSDADAIPICCGEEKELSPKAKFLFYH